MKRNQYLIDLITILDDYDLLVMYIDYAFKRVKCSNLEGSRIYILNFKEVEDREKLKEKIAVK